MSEKVFRYFSKNLPKSRWKWVGQWSRLQRNLHWLHRRNNSGTDYSNHSRWFNSMRSRVLRRRILLSRTRMRRNCPGRPINLSRWTQKLWFSESRDKYVCFQCLNGQDENYGLCGDRGCGEVLSVVGHHEIEGFYTIRYSDGLVNGQFYYERVEPSQMYLYS